MESLYFDAGKYRQFPLRLLQLTEGKEYRKFGAKDRIFKIENFEVFERSIDQEQWKPNFNTRATTRFKEKKEMKTSKELVEGVLYSRIDSPLIYTIRDGQLMFDLGKSDFYKYEGEIDYDAEVFTELVEENKPLEANTVYPQFKTAHIGDRSSTESLGGLTKRELFALGSMIGLESNPDLSNDFESTAELAVKQADALIKELEK